MPEFSSHQPGAPCWVDLMSPDPQGSKAFYQAVFGWDAEDQFDDDGNYTYTLFSVDGKNVAGLGGQPPDMGEMPPVWNSYVATDDPAAVAEAATAAGGTVMMPPMQIMEAGEMAIIADPTGAVISVWKAGEHIGAELCNEPNTWSWNELMTRDVESAKAFYSKVFGWSYDAQDMPMGVYNVIEGGENNGLGGIMDAPPDLPAEVPNHWGVYFTVSDIDATIAKLNDAGGSVLNPPMTVPGVGTFAPVMDGAGAAFNLMQPEA